MQRGPLTESLHHWAQQRQVGELVPVPLEKQHRDPHLRQMLRALVVRSPGRMQWEAEEHEPPHARERLLRLSRGRHTPAERLAARDERQSRRGTYGLRYLRDLRLRLDRRR